jgi:protein-S-isoprenylcysteine O-methyltransferase Ste14
VRYWFSMASLSSFLRRLVAALVLGFHAVPTYACIANPLIGMIAPIGVEWLLLSAWSPFYLFWETRWLVFDMISIPSFFGLNPNPIVGWSLFVVGLCLFLLAAVQFLVKRTQGFVTTGLYSKVRHPQYLGIITATLGFTVTSERPMAWVAWLNMTFLYLLLANSEEKLLERKYKTEFQTYKQQVPFVLPTLPSGVSRKIPRPKTRLGTYMILLVVYVSTMAVAWIALKQFSYHPGPF